MTKQFFRLIIIILLFSNQLLLAQPHSLTYSGSSSFKSASEDRRIARQKRYDTKPSVYTLGQIRRTTLRGKVKNLLSGNLKLSYIKDFISFEEKQLTVPMLGSTFVFTVDISEPTLATLKYGDVSRVVFLEPGDVLDINIDGRTFPEGTEFKGKTSEQNEFIYRFNKKFQQYSEGWITNQIQMLKAVPFRTAIDKIRWEKLKFIQDYKKENPKALTTNFVKYIHAEVDYWWANALFQYHEEQPHAKALPASHYAFLNRIKISNNDAASNPNYLKFVLAYLKFREAETQEIILQQIQQGLFACKTMITPVFSDLKEKNILTGIIAGEKARYVSSTSYESWYDVGGIQRKAPWHQVITDDGYVGWVFGGAGELENVDVPERISYKTVEEYKTVQDYQTIEDVKEVIETVVLVGVDKLRVRKTPDHDQVIGYANNGDELIYLGKKSPRPYTFTIRGKTYNEYFYKVFTEDNQEGWVYGGGTQLKEKKVFKKHFRQVPIQKTVVVKKVVKDKTPSKQYSNTREKLYKVYVSGKAYFYSKGLKLYKKIQEANPNRLSKEVNTFVRDCSYREYDVVIERAYSHALRTYKPKPIVVSKPEPQRPTPEEIQAKEERRRKAKRIRDRINTNPIVSSDSKYAGVKNAYELLRTIDLTPVDVSNTSVKFGGLAKYHRSSKNAKVVLYPNPVSDKGVEYNLFIKADGTFSTNLYVSQSTRGKLYYGSREIDLFIEPGNDLSLYFEGNAFYETLSYNGNGAKPNNFLKDLKVEFKNQDKESKGKIFSENSPMAFKRFLTKVYKKKSKYLDRKSSDFAPNFKQYAKSFIDYWYAYNLLNYRWEHPLNYSKPSPMKISNATYYNFMDNININNEEALLNEYYIAFLDVYLNDRLKEKENKGLTKIEIAEKYLHNEVKYHFQAKELTKKIDKGQLETVMFDVKNFMDNCSYQSLRESIKTSIRESKTMLPGMPAPNFTLEDIQGRRVSLSDFRGKIVYLDFWATWCTPCLRMIKNTSEMRRIYGDKGVVFLYVSIDNTMGEWIRHVTGNKITGKHVYAKGGLHDAKVIADYGVSILPATFIIDQQGNIARGNSSQQHGNIQDFIDVLLLNSH